MCNSKNLPKKCKGSRVAMSKNLLEKSDHLKNHFPVPWWWFLICRPTCNVWGKLSWYFLSHPTCFPMIAWIKRQLQMIKVWSNTNIPFAFLSREYWDDWRNKVFQHYPWFPQKADEKTLTKRELCVPKKLDYRLLGFHQSMYP